MSGLFSRYFVFKMFSRVRLFSALSAMVFAALLSVFAASSHAKPPVIAVVDFDTSNQRYHFLGRQFSELLGNALINSGTFMVVEREKMASLVKEINFNASGLVNQKSAVAMGNMSGAAYIMTGRVVSADVKTTNFSGYGVSTKKSIYQLKVTTRIIDTATGAAIFSSSDTVEDELQDTNHTYASDGDVFANLAEQLSYQIAEKVSASGRFTSSTEAASNKVKYVNVTISSEPAGADVELDGIFYGNAGDPMELPSGLHTLKISLPGYEVWQKKVMVRAGLKLKARLAKKVDINITTDDDDE